jgi:hypothetical protein
MVCAAMSARPKSVPAMKPPEIQCRSSSATNRPSSADGCNRRAHARCPVAAENLASEENCGGWQAEQDDELVQERHETDCLAMERHARPQSGGCQKAGDDGEDRECAERARDVDDRNPRRCQREAERHPGARQHDAERERDQRNGGDGE